MKKPDKWKERKGKNRVKLFIYGLLLPLYILAVVIYLIWGWEGIGHFIQFLQVISLSWVTIGILIYWLESDNRKKQKHYQAWQAINLAQEKPGSGGRIQALEELNKDGVSLAGINVVNAYLKDINLQEADLFNADLKRAYLFAASLQKTDLRYAKLQGANLREAKLQHAVLQNANLTKANLWEANLWQTDLRYANLQEVDLRGAKNITIEQLSNVRTLYKAKLDSEIEEQIKKKYSYLLDEEPIELLMQGN